MFQYLTSRGRDVPFCCFLNLFPGPILRNHRRPADSRFLSLHTHLPSMLSLSPLVSLRPALAANLFRRPPYLLCRHGSDSLVSSPYSKAIIMDSSSDVNTFGPSSLVVLLKCPLRKHGYWRSGLRGVKKS